MFQFEIYQVAAAIVDAVAVTMKQDPLFGLKNKVIFKWLITNLLGDNYVVQDLLSV